MKLADLDKRRRRAAAALAYRIRDRIYRIERDLPVEVGHTVIPARAGLGPIRLRSAEQLMTRLGGWLSAGMRPTFESGDATLTWTARADIHHRIATVLPAFLDDVDRASLAAARAHRAYLRTLPEEDHNPRYCEALVRAYRRDYMKHYGTALISVITLGVCPGRESGERGRYAVLDAFPDARATDVTRYGLQVPPRVIALPPAPVLASRKDGNKCTPS